jgi:anti-sigma B factor antagonist
MRVEHGQDGHATIAVDGELDLATALELRRDVAELLGSGVRHLVVDLAGTSFLDSSGLGALLWAAHRLEAAAGDLETVNAQGPALRAIRLAHLEDELHLRATA